LPPKEAYERLAAARLTREQNAAAELLRACLDSSAPQRSGLLRPDERCDDLVRVVQKSQYGPGTALCLNLTAASD
jgi:hypothetical protein